MKEQGAEWRTSSRKEEEMVKIPQVRWVEDPDSTVNDRSDECRMHHVDAGIAIVRPSSVDRLQDLMTEHGGKYCVVVNRDGTQFSTRLCAEEVSTMLFPNGRG